MYFLYYMSYYKQKFELFKKLIDKTFTCPSYKIEYTYDRDDKRYIVRFNFKCRGFGLIINPNSKWYEFKKRIENLISDPTYADTNCHICFEEIENNVSCPRCNINICPNCFSKIKLNSDVYRCPQCRDDFYDAGVQWDEDFGFGMGYSYLH